MKTSHKLIFSVFAVAWLAACHTTSPALTGPLQKAAPVQYAAPKADPSSTDRTFTFQNSEYTSEQKKYDENIVSVLFQVANPKDGSSVNGLTERDFQVTENGIPVPKFQVTGNKKEIDSIVDVAFVVDITDSMGPFIETAKQRLKAFIASSRQQGYHVRMCLSTFGDYVVKKCDRFYDNKSDDQVQEFNTDLSAITIGGYQGEIKPYVDMPENPMRALTSAATSTEWKPDSQHFVILVTDADFYSPDKATYVGVDKKSGRAASFTTKYLNDHQACTGCQAGQDTSAPSMAEVKQVIDSSKVQVFAITPSDSGYNSPLGGSKGIVADSGGKWIKFKNVVNGQSIDTILQDILRQSLTTYQLSYSVDKTQGLNPTLPVEQRNVAITTPSGKVNAKKPSSTMASGRPEYQTTWNIAPEAVQPETVQVFVNDRPVNANEYNVSGTQVTFKSTPPAGAKLRFVYQYQNIEKNLRTEPIALAGSVNSSTTKVYLNGIEARATDVRFGRTMEGDTNLTLADSAMASNDPYNIRRNKGVTVRVVTNYSL